MDNFDGSYAPQSPDLSGLKGSYAPQSPDLSGLNDFDEPDPFSNSHPYFPPQQLSQQPSYPHQSTNHDPYTFIQPPPQISDHYQQPLMTSNNGKMRTHAEDEVDFAFEPTAPKGGGGRKPKKQKVEEEVCTKPAPGIEEGIDVKTKFPVARIKRIMQADEDVGKVAQVTPTAVSKALELFMISIVTKAGDVARAKSSKRVTPAHLKQAVQHDDQFDFLADIIAKVPDAPAPKKKDETEDSDEVMNGSKKKKRAGTKRRKDDDDL